VDSVRQMLGGSSGVTPKAPHHHFNNTSEFLQAAYLGNLAAGLEHHGSGFFLLLKKKVRRNVISASELNEPKKFTVVAPDEAVGRKLRPAPNIGSIVY
jgi:hypothetical protein